MSNRTLLEINHDYCPADADLSQWAERIVSYMRSGNADDLPDGVTCKQMRHHSDPDPYVPNARAVLDALKAIIAPWAGLSRDELRRRIRLGFLDNPTYDRIMQARAAIERAGEKQ